MDVLSTQVNLRNLKNSKIPSNDLFKVKSRSNLLINCYFQVKNRDEAVRTELKTLLRDYHADLYVEDADQGQNIESKTDTSNTGGGEKPSESTSKTSKSEKSEKKVSEVLPSSYD